MPKPTTEAQFWARIRVDERGCWIWTGSLVKGYGTVKVAQHRWYAHRYAWTLKHGPIPDGILVCHHCDNPPCINPDHLFLGTVRDNVRDCIAKGRISRRCPGPIPSHRQVKGERCHSAKLTEAQVRHIKMLRAHGLTYEQIHAQIKIVAKDAIGDIIRGHTWKHL